MSLSIDTDHLEKYVFGDASLRREVLGLFITHMQAQRAMIDETADDEAWIDVMHAMKGSARGVGAWELGDLCATAEKLTGAGADLQAKRLAVVGDIDAALDAALADARALCEAA